MSIDLFQAVRNKEQDVLVSALNDSNINEKNESGETLLHEAVAFANAPAVELLLSNGIDVNQRAKNGQTALHYIALRKNVAHAEAVLKAGGDLQVEDIHGNQPLWTAVFNARGDYSMVRLFLKYGGLAQHKNKHGKSPLDFARQITDSSLVAMLEPVK